MKACRTLALSWVFVQFLSFSLIGQSSVLDTVTNNVIVGTGIDMRYADPLDWSTSSTTARTSHRILDSQIVKENYSTVNNESHYVFITNPYDYEEKILEADTIHRIFSSISSKGYNTVVDSQHNEQLLYAYEIAKIPLYKLNVKNPVISTSFKEDILRLGRDLTPEGIVHKYGTHYITQATYGGSFLKKHTINQSNYKYSPYDKDIFLSTLEQKIKTYALGQNNDTSYIKLRAPQVYTSGGDESSLSFIEWKNTITQNVKPIAVKYKPISELITLKNFPDIDSLEKKKTMLINVINAQLAKAKSRRSMQHEDVFFKKFSLQFRIRVSKIVKRTTGSDEVKEIPYAGDIFMGAFTNNQDIIHTQPVIERGGIDLETLITDEEIKLNRLLDILVGPEDLKNGYINVWDDTKKLVRGQERTTYIVSGNVENRIYFREALLKPIINKTSILKTIDDDVFEITYSLEQLFDAATNKLTTNSFGNSVMDSELIAAATTGDIQRLENLFERGGRRYTEGLLKAVIQNQDSTQVLNTVLDAGVIPTTQDLDLLFTPENFDTYMALTLLERGAKPKNNMIYKAVAFRAPEVIYALLREGAKPVNNDLEFAVNLEDYALVKALMSQEYDFFKASEKELALAVAHNDIELVNQFIAYGAKANSEILAMSLQDKDSILSNEILKITPATAEALTVAAKANNAQFFKELITKNATLIDNVPIELAIQNKNSAILTMGLQHGGDATQALTYAIANDNIDAVQISLENNAAPDIALEYAAITNEGLFTDVLEKFGGEPKEALRAAVEADKAALAKKVLDFDKSAVLDIATQLKPAVLNNNLEIVKMLVERGANPTQGIPVAIENENVVMTKYLLNQGADVSDIALLRQVIKQNNEELTQLLLEQRSTVPNEVIKDAIISNNTAIVSMLMNKEITIDHAITTYAIEHASEDVAIQFVKKLDQVNPTLLEKAARKGMPNVISILLDKNLDPNSAIMAAIIYEQPIVLKQLLLAGAKPSEKLFQKAVTLNFKKGVETLIDFGIDPQGYTYPDASNVLHQIAVSYEDGDLEMIDLFVRQGVNINAKNKRGETPLHLAAQGNATNLPLISKLIEHGALIEARTQNNKTALDYAQVREIKSFLRDLN